MKSAQRKTRLWLWSSLAVLAVLAGSLTLAWSRSQTFLRSALTIPSTGHVLLVDPGMTGQSVIARLQALGFTDHDWRWRWLMRAEPVVVKAGEYQLVAGTRPRELLALLASGNVIQYRFTIVEGWTFKQLSEVLLADAMLGAVLDAGKISAWLEALDPPLTHPEGWFLPETYLYTRGDDALDILRRAHDATRRALADAWAGREENLPLDSPYELLILASIIEKETALDEERNQISGVFIRRLGKGMRLQTDPTVIYGLGDEFDGDIRRQDLQTDTPYNTYTRHGLPPTPIALPGQASLLAAARPAAGDTLYFVANGQGGHTFSATLEDHQNAVNELLERK